MKNYVKFISKNYFQNVLAFILLIFFIDIILFVISATLIACDVMRLQCAEAATGGVL